MLCIKERREMNKNVDTCLFDNHPTLFIDVKKKDILDTGGKENYIFLSI